MNGEISGKKIQNMDIMEVKKTNTKTGLFLQMVSFETKVETMWVFSCLLAHSNCCSI